MKKLMVVVSIVFGLLTSILAACSPATTGEGVTTKSTEKITTTAATATASIGETETEGIQATPPGELPLATERITLTIGLQQNIRVSDYYDNYQTQLINDECGIDLEFELLPADQPQQKFQLMVSSKQELPDIIHLDMPAAARSQYGQDGVFIPLNDYMEDLTFWYKQGDMDPEEFETIRILGTSPDGNFYGFPGYADAFGDIVQYMMNINRTWLEALGLEMPTTTEEFREVLIAFRDEDPNGNNQKDEIPFLAGPAWSGNNWHELINSFVYWQPWYETSYFNVTDGQLWAPFVTDEWQNALRYMRDLVKDGLMSELSFTMTGEEYRATVDLTPDQVNTVGVIGGHYVVLWASGNEHVYHWDALPALKGPEGVNWIPTRTAQYFYHSFITKENPYPEISFRLFDYWTEEKRSLTMRYGIPGEHWEWHEDDPAGFLERYPYLGAGTFALDLADAKYATIPDVQNPWTCAEPQNAIWNTTFCWLMPARTYSAAAAVAPIPNSWAEAKENNMGTEAHRLYINVSNYRLRAGLEPEKTAKHLIFTLDESEEINEIRATINSYVNETIALFATGAMDIDTDWDAYVNSLYEMGLETYMSVSQTAYDRMYK